MVGRRALGRLGTATGVIDEVLAEQVRYYRARAAEYDVTSPQGFHPYDAVVERVAVELRALGPVGRAIELGAGTGHFTGVVASIAERVVAVDSAPEALELLRGKVASPNVETVVADVFAWTPDEPAELVVFAALFSHIPSDRFDAFWAVIDGMLAPGGRAFLIDETPHDLWARDTSAGDDQIVVRTLQDGRAYRIVKVLWDPDELARRLEDAGWRASFTREDPLFWGLVQPR